MSKRTSLSEIMGKSGADAGSSGRLTLKALSDILGDAMPELPHNAVGRYRLLRSLKARFGPNFRSLPGVSDLMKEFDGVLHVERTVQHLKSIKAKR